LGAASFGVAGASIVAQGVHEKNKQLVIAGSATIAGALALAATTVFSRQQPTKTMAAVIDQLHQLADEYPSEQSILDKEDRFEYDFKAIFKRDIEEIPKNARGEKNRQVLIDHCENAFRRFVSRDEHTSTTDLKNLKLILTNKVQDFCESSREVCLRVETDKPKIQEEFFKNKQSLGTFQVRLDSGETHHKGRQVAFITFNGNDTQQVVYKPRDMRIDALIAGHSEQQNSLFTSVNAHLSADVESSINLPTYQFLNIEEGGKRYGYATFLSHKPDDYILNPTEMKTYYRTIGAIQAIAQIFGIVDLHRENILVHDKKPYPIDLEVSFDLETLSRGQEIPVSTGLDNAVREYGIPSIDGITKPTQNKVELMEKNGQIIPMETHYTMYHQEYISEMEKGFEILKEKLTTPEAKGLLIDFIAAIPDNLEIRFVPIPTGDLLRIMQGNVENVAKCLAQTLNYNPALPYHIEQSVTERQTSEDVLHVDVPRMTTGMNGDVDYNGLLFLKVTGKDIKSVLQKKVTDIEFMVLDSDFKESLDYFKRN
ncbi:MAG: DUF4135 domain-containing protein, partial [Parachlamydiaceae bacterium]